MRLEDKLNLALKNKCLVPDLSTTSSSVDISPISNDVKDKIVYASSNDFDKNEIVYEYLDNAIENIKDYKEDEFGIITMMVKQMGQNISLPIKISNYIIDDAQKKMEGHYEVHIIRDQK